MAVGWPSYTFIWQCISGDKGWFGLVIALFFFSLIPMSSLLSSCINSSKLSCSCSLRAILMSLLLGCWKAVKHKTRTALYFSHLNSSENNRTQFKNPEGNSNFLCKPLWVRQGLLLQVSSMPVCSLWLHSVSVISCAPWEAHESWRVSFGL